MPKYKYKIAYFKNRLLQSVLIEINEKHPDWEIIQIKTSNNNDADKTVIYRIQIKQETKEKQISHLKTLLHKAYDIIGANEIQCREEGKTFHDAMEFRKEVKELLKLY